jgi:hypothetical protein
MGGSIKRFAVTVAHRKKMSVGPPMIDRQGNPDGDTGQRTLRLYLQT